MYKQLDYALQFLEGDQIDFISQDGYKEMEDYITNNMNPEFPTMHAVNANIGYCDNLIAKLIKDGYVSREYNTYYRITFEGKVFLHHANWPRKKMPYSYERYKDWWNTAWTVAKTVVTVIYSLALLFLAILQVFPNLLSHE